MILELKVIPGAKRNCLKEEAGGIKIYLTAPAVDGKANQALIAFLAGHYHCKKRDIEIVSGEKSRRKKIRIEGNP